MSGEPIAILTSRPERPAGPHLWPFILIVLALMIVAVFALGSKQETAPTPTPTVTSTPPREARTYTITYRFGVFSPTNLRIHQGDTVRWHNMGVVPVRIVAQLQLGQYVPEFDSISGVAPNGYFSYTFADPGTFGYVNANNLSESGSIIVRQ